MGVTVSSAGGVVGLIAAAGGGEFVGYSQL